MGFLRRLRKQNHKPFAIRKGRRVAVVRPENPQIVYQAIKDIERKQASGLYTKEEIGQQFDAIIEKQNYPTFPSCSHYFLGYAAKNYCDILNDKGEYVATVQSGDSFVDPEGFDTDPSVNRPDIRSRPEQVMNV